MFFQNALIACGVVTFIGRVVVVPVMAGLIFNSKHLVSKILVVIMCNFEITVICNLGPIWTP